MRFGADYPRQCAGQFAMRFRNLFSLADSNAMTTRRSRTAEHGLEQRSLPRRFHIAKHGLERRGKPIMLPIIALLVALGGWFADRASPSVATSDSEFGSADVPVSAISGIDNGTAVRGKTRDGRAYDRTWPEGSPLTEFTVFFHHPDMGER